MYKVYYSLTLLIRFTTFHSWSCCQCSPWWSLIFHSWAQFRFQSLNTHLSPFTHSWSRKCQSKTSKLCTFLRFMESQFGWWSSCSWQCRWKSSPVPLLCSLSLNSARSTGSWTEGLSTWVRLNGKWPNWSCWLGANTSPRRGLLSRKRSRLVDALSVSREWWNLWFIVKKYTHFHLISEWYFRSLRCWQEHLQQFYSTFFNNPWWVPLSFAPVSELRRIDTWPLSIFHTKMVPYFRCISTPSFGEAGWCLEWCGRTRVQAPVTCRRNQGRFIQFFACEGKLRSNQNFHEFR